MVIRLSGFLNPLAFRLTAEKTELTPSRYVVVRLPVLQPVSIPSLCFSIVSTVFLIGFMIQKGYFVNPVVPNFTVVAQPNFDIELGSKPSHRDAVLNQKVLGFGWFPTRKPSEKKPKPSKHRYVVLNQLCKLIPVGMVRNLASEYGVDKEC